MPVSLAALGVTLKPGLTLDNPQTDQDLHDITTMSRPRTDACTVRNLGKAKQKV